MLQGSLVKLKHTCNSSKNIRTGKYRTYLMVLYEHEAIHFSFSRTSKSSIIQGFKQLISMVKTVGLLPPSVDSSLWISGLTSDWFIVFDNADSDAQVIKDFIPSGRNLKSIQIIRIESLSLICVNEMDDDFIHLLLKCGRLESAIGGHPGPVNNIDHAFGLHPLVIINQEGVYMQANKCTAEYLELFAWHYQGTSGRKEIIELVLRGADVNAQGGVGNALIYLIQSELYCVHHASSWCNSQEIIELLLEREADMDAQGGHLSHGNALQAASNDGHKEIVLVLLERGTNLNVNAQGGFYGNALQAASHKNHKEIVQVLLERGVDVNVPGGFYGNALQAASHENQKEIIQVLLERGADVNVQGGFYGNALQAASYKGHKEIVQLLLERGVDVNAQGGLLKEVEFMATNNYAPAAQSEIKFFAFLHNDADVNTQCREYGNTLQAQASASCNGHVEVVRHLLDKGEDVNLHAQEGLHGNLLQEASSEGQIVRLFRLLNKGAGVHTQSGEYGNALQAASYNGHVEIVRHLLDKGEDENAQEGLHGNAKLQVASSGGHTEILRPLLDKSAAVNTWDGEYGNALEGALYIGHVEIARQLLDKGEDVNTQERLYGNAALQTSSSEDHAEIVQLLKLDRGADVNDTFGKALHAASQNGHIQVEIVRLLLDNGADLNVEGGHYAGSPLQAGSFSGHIEGVKPLLLEKGAYVNLADGLFDSAFPLIKEECNGMYTIHPLMHMWSRKRLSKTSVENYGLKARALIIASESIYRKQGRLDETEMLEVDIMNARKAKLGSDHLDTLTSMANLALTYSNQGRWDEAEKLEVDIMNAKKAKLGSDHLGTLASMANLALIYSHQGRWDEAEKLEVDIMNAKKAKLGSNHLGTLTSMANLAFTHSNQGRWDEAEKLQVDIMNASKEKLGSDHPDTLTSTANLAFSYQSMRMWTEAEKLQMEITEARILRVGEEHLDVLVSKNNLARILYLQGKFEEAELLQSHLAKIAGDKFGEKDPLSLIFRSDLASTLSKLGKLDEAEELERHLLENAKGLYGMDHPYTLVFACNLAETLLKQKKLEEAEELAVHGLKIARAIFDPDHMDEAHFLMGILGLVYHEQGKLDEAEKLQVSIVETSKQSESNMGGHGGIRLMDGLISMNNLVLTYQKQGKWEEAEKLQLQVVETSKSKLGPDHPNTLSMMENLLMMYWQQKKLSQSKSLAIHIMEAKTTKLGPEHPESLWAIFNLGMVNQNMGNIYHAEKLVAHALKGMKKQLGNEHPDTQQMIKARIRLLIQLVIVDVIDILKTICKLESLQVFICYYILTWLFG
jgi:ankyrin repeat protein